MPRYKIDEILDHIHKLQFQLEQEFEQLLFEKRAQFKYTLKKGRVIFDEGVHKFNRRYRTGLWTYLRNARLVHLLTAPVIYSVVFPLLLLDLAIFLYQQICFRIYGIPLVKRADYLVIDRQHLAYLNAIEKFNCVYCGYGNGLIEYVREVVARTEQYWCPIKHARRTPNPHYRTESFADYGDVEVYQEKLRQLRKELRSE
ncbi:hypothetical protein BMS3Bbin11_00107 [bacterium BMS3Bbin11]|nr:hypothetical protein BMS3Abin11_01843 [bacterium BMS3Abin11]GBE45028.1 hypothetical protein BMS3Bbin11_00107 [bacterium BMS3Bbin11]HDH08099.1 hypothetical protein [Gammaproteobacteria bacterium]HDZ78956.1 hypothetical protein [Gammaproteobacteria bacterium]